MDPSHDDWRPADPYRRGDLAVATRAGAALTTVGFVSALIALPLAPPAGATALAGVGLFLAGCAAAALHLWRRREPASPRRLLHLLLGGFALAALLSEDVTERALALHPSQVLLILCLGTVTLGWADRVRRSRADARRARRAADELARVDPLTGIANRRALEERLPQALADARRHEEPVSLLVADLDGFKAVNDTHGHQAGDDLLRCAVRGLAAALRLPDPCFRYGGDEFVAILPRAGGREAAEVAARVQSAIVLSCRAPDGVPLRVSVGTATLRDGETPEELLARADAAMFDHRARRRQRSAGASSASAAAC